MKKVLLFLVGLVMSLSLTSCVTSVQASDDVYDTDYDPMIVIKLGTPVYVDNMIAYYIYNGWYYYPYWIGDDYYFHRYRRILPYDTFRDWYRPIPPGHRPMPKMYRPHHRSSTYRTPPPPRRNPNVGGHRTPPSRPHNGGSIGHRPSGGNHSGGMSPRPSGGNHRSSGGGSRMGGRR